MEAALAAMPIIDIDSHYTEPPDLWTSRAPARFLPEDARLLEDQIGRTRMGIFSRIQSLPVDFGD